ncbi:MAG: two-component regulator propeller domain-containing protein [Pyrinomonadaceae bacterium]
MPEPPNLPNPFGVYSIYKDIKGNIWFGTNPVGVCRYDGKSFDWITEEDVTEFRNEGANGVRSITEDKNGDFWFNTENRYSIYDSLTLKSNMFYTRHESIGVLVQCQTESCQFFVVTFPSLLGFTKGEDLCFSPLVLIIGFSLSSFLALNLQPLCFPPLTLNLRSPISATFELFGVSRRALSKSLPIYPPFCRLA